MMFLNRPDGPSAPMCGNKNGFSTLVKVSHKKDLNLSIRVQGPSYKWNLKFTQISCKDVKEFKSPGNCGASNPNGVANFQFNTVEDAFSIEVRNCKDGKCVAKKRRMKRDTYWDSLTEAQLTKGIQRFLPKNPTQRQIEDVLTKIIDGTETQINQYPWMVSLQVAGGHGCGGTLITENWVLTAAHCVDLPIVPDFKDRITMVLGEHDFTTSTEAITITRKVQKVSHYILIAFLDTLIFVYL